MKERSIIRVAVALIWCLALTGAIVGCGTSPPTVPEGLVATAISESGIEVSWEESTDYGEVDGYRIYRNGKFYFKQNGTSFVDSGLMNGTEYCYRVSAYDKEGNRSEKSDRACARTYAVADTTPPTAPTGLDVVVINSTRLDLSWNESTDDNGVIDYYNIYRDNDFLTTHIDNAYSDTGLTASTKYCYVVYAVDPSGNVSGPSAGVCNTTAP